MEKTCIYCDSPAADGSFMCEWHIGKDPSGQREQVSSDQTPPPQALLDKLDGLTLTLWARYEKAVANMRAADPASHRESYQRGKAYAFLRAHALTLLLRSELWQDQSAPQGQGEVVAECDVAANAAETFRWIPVTERLPEKDAEYVCLIYCEFANGPKYIPGMAVWAYGEWQRRRVTHWLELPPLPEVRP